MNNMKISRNSKTKKWKEIDFETLDCTQIGCTQKVLMSVVDELDAMTMREIESYCEENDIIPVLFEKEKLDLVLRLGIKELERREKYGENDYE